MQHWQTTLLVFASLMAMEFIAASAYCVDLTWVVYMRSCSRHNPVTVDSQVPERGGRALAFAAPPLTRAARCRTGLQRVRRQLLPDDA